MCVCLLCGFAVRLLCVFACISLDKTFVMNHHQQKADNNRLPLEGIQGVLGLSFFDSICDSRAFVVWLNQTIGSVFAGRLSLPHTERLGPTFFLIAAFLRRRSCVLPAE